MTLLVSWIAVDSRGPASLYMISDSRLTWAEKDNWDYGKKVFTFSNFPDIIGYCGDVGFPIQVISHIVNLADSGLLFGGIYSSDRKFARIKYKIQELLKSYPKTWVGQNFHILYGTRSKEKEFACWDLKWDNKSKSWSDSKISYSDYSDKIFVLGSGEDEFLQKYKAYQKSTENRTSRAIFHCFCDTLNSIKDKHCGGAPQLVGLYRIRNAINIGIIYKNKRYFSGVPVDNLSSFAPIEWRNELFERMDGETMKILKNAQRQPIPFIKY